METGPQTCFRTEVSIPCNPRLVPDAYLYVQANGIFWPRDKKVGLVILYPARARLLPAAGAQYNGTRVPR